MSDSKYYSGFFFIILLIMLISLTRSATPQNSTSKSENKTTLIPTATKNKTASSSKTNKTKSDGKKLAKAIKKKEKSVIEIIEDLIKDVIQVSNVMEVQLNMKIDSINELNDLSDLIKRITRKLELRQIRVNYKLNMIFYKILKKLQHQLIDRLIKVSSYIESSKRKLDTIDLSIEAAKNLLPSSTSACDLLNTCDKCTASPGCGWCPSLNRCIEGNESGPLKGSCQYYSFRKCPHHSKCERYTRCSDCLQDVGCGWCDNLNSPACIKKIEAEKGLCSSVNFYHLWKSDPYNKCIEVTIFNYLTVVNNKLKRENNKELEIKNFTGINVPTASENLNIMKELSLLYDEKIHEQVKLDRLLRELKKSEEDVKKSKHQESGLQKSMNITDAVFREVAKESIADLLAVAEQLLASKLNKTAFVSKHPHFEKIIELNINSTNTTNTTGNGICNTLNGTREDNKLKKPALCRSVMNSNITSNLSKDGKVMNFTVVVVNNIHKQNLK